MLYFGTNVFLFFIDLPNLINENQNEIVTDIRIFRNDI